MKVTADLPKYLCNLGGLSKYHSLISDHTVYFTYNVRRTSIFIINSAISKSVIFLKSWILKLSTDNVRNSDPLEFADTKTKEIKTKFTPLECISSQSPINAIQTTG